MNEYRRILGVSSIWPAALFGIAPDRGNPPLHAGVITLGRFVTHSLEESGPSHFCLAPHVAMRLGLYLHRWAGGAWRAVSEDPANTSLRLRVRCLPAKFMP